ncbi:NAD(P)/FAD-dependent oxidoreductase [Leucobacter rhizosphaerae]|uniref:NAD(P)/FAD-dependent oxidoreductase n=1 Tax=Leucobacter rhizosphaerae TaxID=2932245 RepID=A0ABY4FWF3_9MICO|nr:NAD(P)/FAD-dependent oxidoreductase [Leucobacter rhizosphaerae]UOQ60619.1 NAD(P)/FAD-dependent oxidoreductase [Leucobacter rhizosphaerae]
MVIEAPAPASAPDPEPTSAPTHDVVIVGGGHNALVAAAYLARAGKSVAVYERLDHVGGAAVSEEPWPGVAARLSRYSYLVSLLPRQIIRDLGLRIDLNRRRYSSYTPDPADPTRGVLVDNGDAEATAASFARVTGDPEEAGRFQAFTARIAPVAERLFPTVTEPLRRRSEVRALIDDDALWQDLFERPLGQVIRASLESDLARGIALTDGLIGTFATADEASLRQNRCFLYHIIGGGTGDWDVPVGGMGRVSGELERAAREAGAELHTGADVTAIGADGTVHATRNGTPETARGRLVLSGVGPAVFERLLAAGGAPAAPVTPERPEGAQVKINMLLSRLPKLRDQDVDPQAAFAGTFHINETLTQLEAAHASAAGGAIPEPLPAEIYCHSLTDPSILSPELQAQGVQTLTLFGLHVPDRLVTPETNDRVRAELLAAAQRSLDSVLAEPIADCLYLAPDGTPCIEARTTLDLEESLGMVGGDIFHGALSWPWAEDDDDLATPAGRWGVATRLPNMLVCGSGARRGGAVSGLGGHNAAQAALEILG